MAILRFLPEGGQGLRGPVPDQADHAGPSIGGAKANGTALGEQAKISLRTRRSSSSEHRTLDDGEIPQENDGRADEVPLTDRLQVAIRTVHRSRGFRGRSRPLCLSSLSKSSTSKSLRSLTNDNEGHQAAVRCVEHLDRFPQVAVWIGDRDPQADRCRKSHAPCDDGEIARPPVEVVASPGCASNHPPRLGPFSHPKIYCRQGSSASEKSRVVHGPLLCSSGCSGEIVASHDSAFHCSSSIHDTRATMTSRSRRQ